MRISGWGNYPVIDSSVDSPLSPTQVEHCMLAGFNGIARGMGRSYGDSSLSSHVISGLSLHHLLDFDNETGVLRCQAGVTLADILDLFVPRGWFLPVTPGTKFVSVGGAIASDVHGKNHHIDGSFCEHITELDLMLADGRIERCSATHNRELFHATCGGMGLTGIILSAGIRLKPITSSYIDEVTLKAPDLTAIIEMFEQYLSSTYSVAWIDCAARGKRMGRSLLMLGEHAIDAPLRNATPHNRSLPFNMPEHTLNRYSIKAFNSVYYHRKFFARQQRRIHYDPYFYPLDGVLHWNRLYGKKGFTQYQFVLPQESSAEGMRQVLERIVSAGRGSPLAVLKSFGRENDNFLSFPRQGLQLALDFKINDGVFEFLNDLDSIVLDHGGRLYLTKDARMSEAMFKQSYPRWQQFMDVRTRYGADKVFNSLQSKRLGI
ncbi:MAG: FAD-binding oxidoreductase [Gammaproteobacteria bacterium]|nr:FAD-binding oxidoreductase [Gammaproteobacteria bacterium]